VHHENQASVNLSFSDASAANSVTWFPDAGVNQHVTLDIIGMTHAEPYLGNDQLYDIICHLLYIIFLKCHFLI